MNKASLSRSAGACLHVLDCSSVRKVGEARLTASDDCSLKPPATTFGEDAIAAVVSVSKRSA